MCQLPRNKPNIEKKNPKSQTICFDSKCLQKSQKVNLATLNEANAVSTCAAIAEKIKTNVPDKVKYRGTQS